jgi:Protein of unknown function with PCYCGC motif
MSRFPTAICAGVAVLALVLALMAIPERAASPAAQAADSEPVPAFHSQVPKGPLPATLDPAQFDGVLVQNSYKLAARVKRVLYQQPCYCHCDRSQGHGSLLDCFAGKHAAECGVCIKEGLYSYEQTKKGKTAAQIRDGIEKGEWQQLDLAKYQTSVASAN